MIDDLYVDPDGVRRLAFENNFPQSQAYYPGRHQPLSPLESDVRAFCHFIARVLSHATGRNVSGASIATDFSILTTPEKALLNLQGQPHVDGSPMLGVIYLNDGDYGGTVFFRNRETGSMSIVTPDQQEHYRRITAANATSSDTLQYVVDSTDDWERVDVVDGRKNRLVIWPGNVFHSIQVKVPPELGSVSSKRLTQRVIINSVV